MEGDKQVYRTELKAQGYVEVDCGEESYLVKPDGDVILYFIFNKGASETFQRFPTEVPQGALTAIMQVQSMGKNKQQLMQEASTFLLIECGKLVKHWKMLQIKNGQSPKPGATSAFATVMLSNIEAVLDSLRGAGVLTTEAKRLWDEIVNM